MQRLKSGCQGDQRREVEDNGVALVDFGHFEKDWKDQMSPGWGIREVTFFLLLIFRCAEGVPARSTGTSVHWRPLSDVYRRPDRSASARCRR